MGSVRTRLLLVLAAGFALLIGAAALLAERVVAGGITAEFDAALLARARMLGTLTEQEEGRIEFDYQAEFMPEFERAERPHYYQFRLADGTPLARSARLDADLPRASGEPGPVALFDVRLPDGRPGRAARVRFAPRGPGDDEDAAEEPARAGAAADPLRVELVLARDRIDLDRRIGRLRLAILGGGGAFALLAGFLVWLGVRAAFRPIGALAARVRRLDADTLGTRLPLEHTPRELAPMVEQLNALLARLEASFRRERRFTGNVAHELRTPIAELRSLAEVGGRWPDDARTTRAFFEDVSAISARMERLVGDLLLLARCESGVEPVRREPVDVRAMVAEAWAARGCGEAADPLGEVPEGLRIATDAGKFSILLGALLDNAASHAAAGGRVRCRGARVGDRVRIVVSNPAERLDPDDLARLTEPFWRKDEARSSERHAGLGLSLAAAIARMLGLSLRFRQGDDGLFEAVVEGEAG